MKVTTVRFGRDLWELLETEAQEVGTSVSQYIREAAMARAAAAAARRGESPFDLLADALRRVAVDVPPAQRRELDHAHALIEDAQAMRAHARTTREGSQALKAQSRQATSQSDRKLSTRQPP